MQLFAGTSHPALAQNLAEELGVTLGKLELKQFSCGEQYVKFGESIRGKNVYILQTATREPDKDLMQLFLICQAAKLSFAASVHVVMPHFPYARQDRVAEPREPISAKLVAHLLEETGANHLMTLDLHSSQIQGFFSIPVDSLDARSVLVRYFREKKLQNPVIVSPDVGGAKRAKKFADSLGAELAIMHKTRPQHQKSEVVEVVGNIEGRTCIIIDDMIDTAGSLCAATQALAARGALPDVYAAATHAIFSGNAQRNIAEAGLAEIVVTDTIPLNQNIPNVTVLPIAPLLAEVIKHIELGQSVTEIYEQ